MNHAEGATVESYLDNYADAFIEFQKLIEENKAVKKCYVPKIAIDCANGVGAIHLKVLAEKLKEYIEIVPFNTDIENKVFLNHNCGAEYV